MLKKIVSGGQTGVDRGALDAALALGFPCGGWCPAGRLAEDGVVPARYPLVENDVPGYLARTRRNVEESDGTLVLAHGALAGGTRATAAHANRTGRPCLVVDLDRLSPAAAVEETCRWLADNRIAVLNVAGPRGSSHPGIHAEAERIVRGVIAAVAGRPEPD